jgi:hypothetical protein
MPALSLSKSKDDATSSSLQAVPVTNHGSLPRIGKRDRYERPIQRTTSWKNGAENKHEDRNKWKSNNGAINARPSGGLIQETRPIKMPTLPAWYLDHSQARLPTEAPRSSPPQRSLSILSVLLCPAGRLFARRYVAIGEAVLDLVLGDRCAVQFGVWIDEVIE